MGIDDQSSHPRLCSAVADSVTCNGYGDCVSLLREPDAANPHVRFDEREVETGQGQASEAPADERAGHRWACLNHRATSRLYNPFRAGTG